MAGRARVEVEHQRRRVVGVIDRGLVGVELERGEVGDPDQGGDVVDHAADDVAVDLPVCDPLGAVLGAVLLEERRARRPRRASAPS